jgi:hypothetical protein
MGFGLNYAGREPTNPMAARRVPPITKSRNEFLTLLNQNNLGVPSVCFGFSFEAKRGYTSDGDRVHPPVSNVFRERDGVDNNCSNEVKVSGAVKMFGLAARTN